ncbi:TBC1 domain family member 7 [Patella vulgata]|uniref:TBC1 domain family member 7 n=1 Tax=Patella vulgata TaxID=6465 RepID=UPI0021802D7C|nr:TBC1 domain family member 7 [Patella vulgata]
MTEERNFRQYYYKKCGFRLEDEVEEKKSVEILSLLKEPFLDADKLRHFCLRFSLPAMYRLMVWKVLLGILPTSQDSHKFVTDQRNQQYKDIHHGLTVLRRISSQTPEEEILFKMYLLDQGCLPFEETNMRRDPRYSGFLSIARGVCSLTDDRIEQYWISTKFFSYFHQLDEDFQSMVDKTVICLKKEDCDLKLFHHLEQNNVLDYLPLIDWFRGCFGDVLPETSFERIWDKVIGGSLTILIYVAVSIFLTFKRPLLSMNNTDDMITYLKKIPTDCGDRVVNDALETWQKNGGYLIQPDTDIHLDKSL